MTTTSTTQADRHSEEPPLPETITDVLSSNETPVGKLIALENICSGTEQTPEQILVTYLKSKRRPTELSPPTEAEDAVEALAEKDSEQALDTSPKEIRNQARLTSTADIYAAATQISASATDQSTARDKLSTLLSAAMSAGIIDNSALVLDAIEQQGLDTEYEPDELAHTVERLQNPQGTDQAHSEEGADQEDQQSIPVGKEQDSSTSPSPTETEPESDAPQSKDPPGRGAEHDPPSTESRMEDTAIPAQSEGERGEKTEQSDPHHSRIETDAETEGEQDTSGNRDAGSAPSQPDTDTHASSPEAGDIVRRLTEFQDATGITDSSGTDPGRPQNRQTARDLDSEASESGPSSAGASTTETNSQSRVGTGQDGNSEATTVGQSPTHTDESHSSTSISAESDETEQSRSHSSPASESSSVVDSDSRHTDENQTRSARTEGPDPDTQSSSSASPTFSQGPSPDTSQTAPDDTVAGSPQHQDNTQQQGSGTAENPDGSHLSEQSTPPGTEQHRATSTDPSPGEEQTGNATSSSQEMPDESPSSSSATSRQPVDDELPSSQDSSDRDSSGTSERPASNLFGVVSGSGDGHSDGSDHQTEQEHAETTDQSNTVTDSPQNQTPAPDGQERVAGPGTQSQSSSSQSSTQDTPTRQRNTDRLTQSNSSPIQGEEETRSTATTQDPPTSHTTSPGSASSATTLTGGHPEETEPSAAADPHSTQNLVPVDYIYSEDDPYSPDQVNSAGLIKHGDMRYIGIVEITPRNWSVLQADEQDAVAQQFVSEVYASLEFPICAVVAESQLESEDYKQTLEARQQEVEQGERDEDSLLTIGRRVHMEWIDQWLDHNDITTRQMYLAVAVTPEHLLQHAENRGLLANLADLRGVGKLFAPFAPDPEDNVTTNDILAELDSRLDQIVSQLKGTDLGAERVTDPQRVTEITYQLTQQQDPPGDLPLGFGPLVGGATDSSEPATTATHTDSFTGRAQQADEPTNPEHHSSGNRSSAASSPPTSQHDDPQHTVVSDTPSHQDSTQTNTSSPEDNT